jgi:hypothetical protein
MIVRWTSRAIKDLRKATKEDRKSIESAVDEFAETNSGDVRHVVNSRPSLSPAGRYVACDIRSRRCDIRKADGYSSSAAARQGVSIMNTAVRSLSILE